MSYSSRLVLNGRYQLFVDKRGKKRVVTDLLLLGRKDRYCSTTSVADRKLLDRQDALCLTLPFRYYKFLCQRIGVSSDSSSIEGKDSACHGLPGVVLSTGRDAKEYLPKHRSICSNSGISFHVLCQSCASCC